MEGYIKVYRKMMCSPIWHDPDLFRLWMYCLMKASHKDRKVLVDKQEINLNSGQFVTGRFSLHQEFNQGIPPRKQTKDTTLWNWLKKLESMGNIDIKSSNKYSVISIINWCEYQETLTTDSQQDDNKVTTDSQQIDTNKNVNNVNNVKNVNSIYAEIINYLNEKAETKFKHTTKKTKDFINARLNENFTKDDMFLVIDYCCKEWKGKIFSNGKKGDDYLQPSTLFNNKFDERLQKALKTEVNEIPREPDPTPQFLF